MALSRDFEARRQDGELIAYNVASGKRIYKGSMVCVNTGGLLVPASDTGASTFVGVAYEGGSNPAMAENNLKPVVRVCKTGVFQFLKDNPAQSDVGKSVYISDDNKVALTGTIPCGVVVGLGDEAGYLKVKIDGAVK